MIPLSYNYVLITAVISWCAAQVIKTLIHMIRYRTFDPERLFGAGGMPSSHSALVCSATLAMARQVGTSGPEFAIMFLLAIVVMYDAMGVRRAAGQHAHEINKMNRYLEANSKGVSEDSQGEWLAQTKKLKEYLGHTPFEVLGGALLGLIMALLIPMEWPL